MSKLFIRRLITDSQRWRIVLLSAWGFHGKFIAKVVEVKLSSVYRICREEGIRLRDYRDGLGDSAAVAIGRCKDDRRWGGSKARQAV